MPSPSPPTFGINGTVTFNSSPEENRLVTITAGGTGSDLTDVAGAYLIGMPSGVYSVAPTLFGAEVSSPSSYTGVTIIDEAVYGLDFNITEPGDPPPSSIFPATGVPLYIYGHEAINSNISLYIMASVPHNSGTTLFISGDSPSNSGINLYVRGWENYYNEIPLFIHGDDESSSSITLFTGGIIEASQGMPLYLNGGVVPTSDEILELFLHGSNQSGVFRGSDLSISGDNLYTSSMPLFINATNMESSYAELNLWLDGEVKKYNKSFDLTLYNNDSGISLGTTLHVSGEGISEGFQPYNSNMNLFLDRDTANGMTCYIQGPGTQTSGSVYLNITGNQISFNNTNLSIPNSVGYPTRNTRLYTHGF